MDDEKRLQVKVQLVRNLISKGISRKKIRHLLDFISHYISFEKEDFFNNFEKEIQPIIKQRESMGIREAILKEAEEKGIEKIDPFPLE